MNNTSKIILLIILCIALWWGYDTFVSKKKTEPIAPVTEVQEKLPVKEEIKPEEVKDSKIYIYLLTTDKSGSQFLKPVSRPLPPDVNKLEYSIQQLLSGPNNSENNKNIYSEIPESVKLISVKDTGDKVIIDVTENFSSGGGSDSIYSRMRQLIKTALSNTNKPVYLHIDGKQADVIGGEGISISQPLSEKSLDE